MRTRNYIFFFQNKCNGGLKKKLVFSFFKTTFIKNRHSIYLEEKKYNSESTLFTQLLNLIW